MIALSDMSISSFSENDTVIVEHFKWHLISVIKEKLQKVTELSTINVKFR